MSGTCLKRNISTVDKKFDILKFITKQLMGSGEYDENEGCFLTTGTYSPNLDNIKVFVKDTTGSNYDYVVDDRIGDCIKNKKHFPGFEYGATQFLMYVYDLNKTQAKNKAIELITDDYEDHKEEEPEQVEDYIYSETMKILPIWENLDILLKKYNCTAKLNVLKRRIDVTGSIASEVSYDDVITKLNTLCEVNKFKLAKDKQYDFMRCIGGENKVNVVTDYLEECFKKRTSVTSKQSAIDQLFNTITYTNNHEIEFNNKVLLKALLGFIHLAYNTGTNFTDFMIILKGKQGLGKTQWIKSLFPKEHLLDFFAEGINLDLKDKDSLIQNTAYWVIELGEFGKTLRENDRDKLKAFIGKSIDEFRVPYSRSAVKHPRHTGMIGSLNDEEFLRDTTGNRRFVTLEVTKMDYTHNIDVDMLWGELMVMYKSGEHSTFLTVEENEEIAERNKSYMIRTDTQIAIEEYIPFSQPKEDWKPTTCTLIADYLKVEHGRLFSERQIGKALASMGHESPKTSRLNGKPGRYYTLPYVKGMSLPF